MTNAVDIHIVANVVYQNGFENLSTHLLRTKTTPERVKSIWGSNFLAVQRAAKNNPSRSEILLGFNLSPQLLGNDTNLEGYCPNRIKIILRIKV